MSEAPDKDSKTEPATEKKIRDTVEKGQLPFSKEAPIFASLTASLVFALFFAQDSAVRLGGFLSIFLERPDAWPLENTADAIAVYRLVFTEIARAIAAIMILLVSFGFVAAAFQNTPRFVLDRIQPKLERISPMSGWKRLFGAKGLVEFLKSVAKLCLTVACVGFALGDVHPDLLAGMMTSPSEFTMVIRDIGVRLLTAVVLVMAAIAVADFVWQRYHWLQDLMMTKQEVKDEHKQAEGDPILKARMRSLARDRVRQRMMSAVPRATLVIANPTHYAIALRYERDRDAAPTVVAKGVDLVALRIREIAEANGVPVFENPPLARSMYKQVSVDSMIPHQFYHAVAELVRIVYAKRPGSAANKGLA
ncbi:MAG: flagellar biosynthesis protein FlhB [Rhizobiaceae bacterium]|nr:flagellar biosynthesis protein FlhB [Rhizobiaceae bacterium]MCV0409187.1 flagellar biosynthesis protein FlhB [Rhizobiaceae bacterium]